MENNLKIIVFLLIGGVFGVDTDEVKHEGDSVTLKTNLNEIQKDHQILWRLIEADSSKKLLVQIRQNKVDYKPSVDGGLRVRLRVDTQTGDLTIRNLRMKYSGLYEAEINNPETSYKRFNVIVKESPRVNGSGPSDVKSVSVKEGKSVTLQTDVQTQRGDLILWRFGDKNLLIAKGDMEDNKISYIDDDVRFRGRLKMNNQTGDLTITNFINSNAEVYNLKIISSRETKYKTFTVSLSVSGVLWFQTITYVGLPFLILLLLTFLCKYLPKIMQKVWSRRKEWKVFYPVLILLLLILCLVVMLLLLGSDLILSFQTSNLHTTLVCTAIMCLSSLPSLLWLLFIDFNNFRKKLICECYKVRIWVDIVYFAVLGVLLVLIGVGLIYFLSKVSASDKTLCNTEEMILFLMALLVLFVACLILKITDDMKKCGGSTGEELNRRMGDLILALDEGDRVTLPAPKRKLQSGAQIEWKLSNLVIIRGEKTKDEGIRVIKRDDQQFKGGLKLDPVYGHLIIKSISKYNIGLYKVKITNNIKTSRTRIHVKVIDNIYLRRPDNVSDTKTTHEGERLYICGAVSGLEPGNQIEWIFNGRVIMIGVKTDDEITEIQNDDQQFKHRLELNFFCGYLIISNITKEDAGLYEVKITNNERTLHYKTQVNVKDSTRTNRNEPAAAGMPLLSKAEV